MKKESFNNGWLYYKGSGTALEKTVNSPEAPVEVTLPHDAMIGEYRDPKICTGNATGYYPYKTVHYIKDFELNDVSGSCFIKFEGVYKNTSVFVNGCLVKQHSNGYTPFNIDISPFVKIGKNSIKVLVRNGVPSSRWYTGTGIYRDVWMYTGGNVFIEPDSIKITTLQADSEVAVLQIKTVIVNRNNSIIKTSLTHKVATNETVTPVTLMPNEKKEINIRMEVDSPILWDTDTPFLYECQTEIKNYDCEKNTFGIRALSLDTKRGLCINGKSVKLRGGCIHHDHGIIGAVEHKGLTYRRIRKLKDSGYNAVRCAHFPTSQTVLDACDELGMLVMVELCDAWTQPKIDFDYSSDFESSWEKDTKAMVELVYNHPSVIIYSIGNEIGETSNPVEAQYGRKITELIRTLDRGRYITNCINIALSLMDQIPHLAVKAGADINSIMNGDKGELVRLMASKEIGEPLEEAFSYLDIAGYNYAAYRYEADSKLYPHRIILGAECYPGELFENWAKCQSSPQIIGDFGWAAWDYLGEAGVGQHRYGDAVEYDLYGAYPWKTANCGDFDLIGDRRPISYWRQIVWGLRKEPYIAVQSPEHYGEKQSPTRWGWSDAKRSWNYRGFEGKPIMVEVYSNADEVELFRNGESLGKKKPIKCKTCFDITYEPGELYAINYKDSQKTGDDKLLTASYNVLVKNEYLGDGITEISIMDENGILNPDADIQLEIPEDDMADIIGFGSADPKSEENYFDRVIKTYNGRALVVSKGDRLPRIEVKS